jgi:hypothetical protein
LLRITIIFYVFIYSHLSRATNILWIMWNCRKIGNFLIIYLLLLFHVLFFFVFFFFFQVELNLFSLFPTFSVHNFTSQNMSDNWTVLKLCETILLRPDHKNTTYDCDDNRKKTLKKNIEFTDNIIMWNYVSLKDWQFYFFPFYKFITHVAYW